MHARPKVFILVLFLFAVFLMGSSISSVSVSALAYQSPHGPYDSFPVGCAACHVAHAGGGPNLLNGAVNTTTLCLACHDGTASVFNVVYVPKEDPVTGITQAVYGLGFYDTNATHFHPVRNTQNPAVGQVLECTNCHNPHGDSSGGGGVYARLLNSYDGTSRYYQGPEYCLGCHGAADRGFASVENPSVSYYTYTLGNHRNPNAAHYLTEAPELLPPSGTEVTCAKCHYKHASDQGRLLAGTGENLCFKCHNNAANSMNARNIRDEFESVSTVSYHDIYGRTGAVLECTSCHGPHTVGAKSLSVVDTIYSQVANPDNTKSVMAKTYAVQDNGVGNTVGDLSDFCIKCHDGDPPKKTDPSTTEYVPYTIVFPNTPFTNNAGGWDKKEYKTSAHGANATKITCGDCHESHGSDYPALQRYAEDDETTDGECLRCHKSGGSAPDIKTDFLKTSRHKTLTIDGKHSNTEDYTNISVRHAECADCHDVHQATKADAITGVSGVSIDYAGSSWSNWPPAQDKFTFKRSLNHQYELCFKCHSCYSYGSSPPSGYTDQAREFNPNNKSYHAVWGGTKMPPGYGLFVPPWEYNSPMKCTDCHGSNSTTAPKGPHGSTEKFILKKKWNPDTGAADATGKPGTQDHLCFLCHEYKFYVTGEVTGTSKFSGGGGGGGSSNLHVRGGCQRGHIAGCASCHGAIPHGSKRRGMLVIQSDGAPYNTGVKITGLPETLPDEGTWQKNDCSTAAGCHSCGGGGG